MIDINKTLGYMATAGCLGKFENEQFVKQYAPLTLLRDMRGPVEINHSETLVAFRHVYTADDEVNLARELCDWCEERGFNAFSFYTLDTETKTIRFGACKI